MQAANDNLPDAVSGVEDDECSWEALHEAARKAVEACARERAASHQLSREERGGRETSRHHDDALGLTRCGDPVRLACWRRP